MRRFYIEYIKEGDERIEISGDEFTHLKKVLRLTEDSPVAVFNGKGLELTGRIESIGKDSAIVKIESESVGRKESALGITLLQGLLKGDKPELIIQKATELGVNEISFYTTARTVPLLGEGRIKGRLSRWQKVAVEAAKQCGRSVVPKINEVIDFKEAIALDAPCKLILWEGVEQRTENPRVGEPTANLKDVFKGKTGPVTVIVGPEGGLSREDVEAAKAKGFTPVSLGPRILRAETAAITIVSLIQHEMGDLN